MVPCAIAYRIR